MLKRHGGIEYVEDDHLSFQGLCNFAENCEMNFSTSDKISLKLCKKKGLLWIWGMSKKNVAEKIVAPAHQIGNSKVN